MPPLETFSESQNKGIRRLVSSTKNIQIDPIFKNAKNDDIVIPVMGPTGVGKSTFISTLASAHQSTIKVEIGHGLRSCTSEIQAVPFQVLQGPLKGRRVVMVDTPGFSDISLDDAEVLKRIALWLGLSYYTGMKLAGVIYLYDISETRMLIDTLNNLQIFHNLCGHDARQAVILMTTKWGAVDLSKGEKRENALRGEFWKSMIDAGSQIYRFDLSTTSATNILNTLGENYNQRETAIILQIQEEVVDMAKRIPDTKAGRKLRHSLQQLLDMQKSHSRNNDEIQKTLRQLKSLKIPFSQRFLGFLGLAVGHLMMIDVSR